ncbi:LOW QUALITY PROTEIN: sulfotransferase 1C4, partial [Hyalella azteca]|uniref:LOW QUALITY PROTEIN: sulfotransferase 1C4 n=1 Tax=Hyalella azteca TaxID=294128 RepID=A0A979FP25_HYAAZ
MGNNISEVFTKIASGHTVHEVDCATKKKIDKLLTGPCVDVVLLRPHNWVVLRRFLKIHEMVYNFQFRPDDVVVMTYPKCGTTWSQEIVWNMRNNPDLDNPDADDALFVRSPYLEIDMLSGPKMTVDFAAMVAFTKGIQKYVWNLFHLLGSSPMFKVAEAHWKPRTIKTHLPFSMLPKNLLDTCKVVYVSRNPKDNVLSAQHHYKLHKMANFIGTQDEFVDLYVEDLLLYSPYGQHLREAWSRRHHPNFFMMTYEELKADTRQQLTKLDAGTQDEFVDLYVEDLLLYSPYGQHLREAWSRRHHPNFFMMTFEELKADTRQQLTKLDAFLGTGLTDKQFDN